MNPERFSTFSDTDRLWTSTSNDTGESVSVAVGCCKTFCAFHPTVHHWTLTFVLIVIVFCNSVDGTLTSSITASKNRHLGSKKVRFYSLYQQSGLNPVRRSLCACTRGFGVISFCTPLDCVFVAPAEVEIISELLGLNSDALLELLAYSWAKGPFRLPFHIPKRSDQMRRRPARRRGATTRGGRPAAIQLLNQALEARQGRQSCLKSRLRGKKSARQRISQGTLAIRETDL